MLEFTLKIVSTLNQSGIPQILFEKMAEKCLLKRTLDILLFWPLPISIYFYLDSYILLSGFLPLPKVHVNCVLALVTDIDVHSVSPTITVKSPALDPRFVPVK